MAGCQRGRTAALDWMADGRGLSMRRGFVSEELGATKAGLHYHAVLTGAGAGGGRAAEKRLAAVWVRGKSRSEVGRGHKEVAEYVAKYAAAGCVVDGEGW